MVGGIYEGIGWSAGVAGFAFVYTTQSNGNRWIVQLRRKKKKTLGDKYQPCE